MRAVLVVAGLLLAGCTQAPEAAPGLPVDAEGRSLPTVQGHVVDEAIRPLAGARVFILGTDVEAFTDTEGHYELRRPTGTAEAGLVTAYLAGYVATTHQVHLSAYRSAKQNFVLGTDPYAQARFDVQQHTDRLECRARAAGQDLSCAPENPVQTGDPPEPRNVWVVNPDPGLAGVVVEVHWNPVSDGSQHLQVALRAPVAGGFSGATGTILAQAGGPSPLRLELDEATSRSLPRWTAVHVEVSLAPEQPGAPAAVAYNQVYDAFASLFYVDPAPAGYVLGG